MQNTPALLEQVVPRAVLFVLVQPSIHSISGFAFFLLRLGMVAGVLAIPPGGPVAVTFAHSTASGVTVSRE